MYRHMCMYLCTHTFMYTRITLDLHLGLWPKALRLDFRGHHKEDSILLPSAILVPKCK